MAALEEFGECAHPEEPHDLHLGVDLGQALADQRVVTAAVLAGGNIRVGLEDCIWLGKNQPATNGALVERAAHIVTAMGASLMGPAEVREKLKLKKR